ncbi:alpha-hydroxy-acid oxidizing protein [Comamonas testosteroni]|uniref:Alpha-hydroxy-acid oxidizing protein n=1 Tax=Comamonas testosteroni TaxID=285 RepID=A0A373FMR8_COMTE|nr:alpha-hydroxy acid oxidase [Comamonas testosteroni]RGE44785.1 alpha-hydroxy-acid oxidizing protein [Comamonas testosteroni]
MTSAFERRQFMKTAAAGAVLAGAGLARAQAAKGEAAAPLTVGLNAQAEPRKPFQAPGIERPLHIADLNDLEAEAQKVMDPGAFAFISSGSDSQWTLRENRAAFGRVALKPQYLVGKPAPDLRITLLGQQLSMPIITTPMGAHGLAHQSAELGTARGTGEAGTLMTVSTAANRRIEDIAAATQGPKWFQLYLADDLSKSRDLIKRAEAAGYSAIVLAIDAFAPGSSDATIRMGFSFPPSLPLVNSGSSIFKKSLSWDDVKFVQNNTKLPLVLKGVLTPEMAQKALEHGVSAIQVSNHGGRQLDGVPAAFDALPAVVDVVKGKVPIIMDSGIRRGTDVFKALAMGANAVAIGRPVLYGLSLGGWMGVKSVYERLQTELARDMMIAGVASVAEFSRAYVMPAASTVKG